MKTSIYLTLVFMFLSLNVAYANFNFSVISHPQVVPNQISMNELKEIFLGNKIFWPNNERIFVAIVEKDEQFAEEFLQKYLNKNFDDYIAYWRRKLFSGKGIPPRKFKTNKTFVEFIAQTEGALGIIFAEEKLNNIKTLTIVP